MQNPQQGMEQMFGNNPVFQQARKMAEGKSPEQNLPEGANTLPVQISIGGTTYPVYTRTGNLLRADQIRCRRVYPIIFGNDPNHFSLLCCVPNTVYTPPVVVPTEG